MKNEYIVNWERVKKWINESQHSGIRLIFFIFWCVMLVVCLTISVSSLIVSDYADVALYFTFSLFCVYRAFIFNLLIAKKQYKRVAQTYGKDSWVRSITFSDEKIIIVEEKTEMQYDYSDILSITEKDNNIYLHMQAKAIIRLYKSKFIDSTWEECKNKILEMNPNIK